MALAVTLALACGPPGPASIPNGISSSAATGANPASSVSPTLADNAPFDCSYNSQTGGESNVGQPVSVTAARLEHQNGYDRFGLEFAGTVLPTYRVQRQNGTVFQHDPSGQVATLPGDTGLLVRLTGARMSSSASPPSQLVGNQITVPQAQLLGNFEGVVDWGLGAYGRGCFRTGVLYNPTRLVVDVQH